MKDDEDEMELAILLEDYEAFDDEAHASRLHWVSPEGALRGADNAYKPRLVNGRRVSPGPSQDG